MLLTLIAFLLILSILVFVHELGHFMVAKWTGMRVDEFALGFPPRLWSKKRGETTYAVNAIPFGGYVKIHGEAPGTLDESPRSFNNKPVLARILVIIAGVCMNIIFAFVVFTIAFSFGFSSYAQDLTQIPGSVVTHNEVDVVGVLADSPAAKIGIVPGDIIKTLTNPTTGVTTAVSFPNDLVTYTKAAQTAGVTKLDVLYNRDGTDHLSEFTINPTGPALGVSVAVYQVVRIPVWRAPGAALKEMGYIVSLTWDALAQFGHKLFFSAQLDPNVSGPVGIYAATGQATHAGVIPTIFLIVALSLNLALLNILPIPALDGGKLFFLLIELVFGKKAVNRHVEGLVTFVGFVLVMGLVVILSVRDLIHLL